MKTKTRTVTWTPPDGVRRYYRGKTKKEAEEKRRADQMLSASGVVLGDQTTFEELAESWFTIYKDSGKHIRTVETVENTFNRYILPVIGSLRLRDIDVDALDRLSNSIKDYSVSTQRKVIQYTKLILDRAVAKGLIPRSPVDPRQFRPTAKKPAEIVPLTDEQCEVLLSATEGTRVYPFLVVLRYCGLRKGEALGLMWKDIDFEAMELHVQRSIVYPECNKAGEINPDLKTENADRIIPLPPAVCRVLKAAKHKSHSIYVFSMKDGNFMSESSFRKMWELVTRRTIGKGKGGVECTIDFDVHPHLLRHTCITSWFEQGLDVLEVMKLAGHASPEITTRVYTHYRESQRYKSTADKVRSLQLNLAAAD